MWFIKLVTFLEDHLYAVVTGILLLIALLRFFRKESQRPSYRQQQELERFLQGFRKDTPGRQEKKG
ncbi:hypothetical protein U27_06938 [Candidatus Vecturithrix granuli]|uniref:Uncharacterized protein n=1 Tax=Vecturithrix granuli TaxID=1499967 RepID=A0A081C5U7_VECG1|nr:hypothetical protein U27_06938 [Candidatus Vecturithrix granuli]